MTFFPFIWGSMLEAGRRWTLGSSVKKNVMVMARTPLLLLKKMQEVAIVAGTKIMDVGGQSQFAAKHGVLVRTVKCAKRNPACRRRRIFRMRNGRC